MWVAREIVRLIERVVVAFAVALALAVLWAAVSDRGLTQSLRATCLGIGCLALLMGGIGRDSNFERAMDYSITQQFWGKVPGVSPLESKGEDRTLAPGAVFVLTGLALLAVGVVLL